MRTYWKKKRSVNYKGFQPAKSKLNIEAVPDSYRKARRSYLISSALLISWELIGLSIESIPNEIVEVKLESPEAAPYVILFLVFYFIYRMTIEWYHLDENRRSIPVTKVDYYISHSVGVLSILIFSVQTYFKLQLADLIPENGGIGVVLGLAFGYLLSYTTLFYFKYRNSNKKPDNFYLRVIFIPLFGLIGSFGVLYWEIINGDSIIISLYLISVFISYVPALFYINKIGDVV